MIHGVVAGARVLSRETVFGTAVTIIPAAVAAASIWFFAIRTPPPRPVVEQKPAAQLNQSSRGQTNVALIEPPVTKPAPPVLPPEPKPPPQGGLSVVTAPPGAKVIVDASIVKTTPALMSNLAVGKHHLQIVLPDYVTEERDVDVRDGEIASQGVVTLRPITPPVGSTATVTADGVTKPMAKGPEQERVAVVKKAVHSKAPKPAATPSRQVVAAPQPPAPAKTISKPAGTPKQKLQRAFEGGVPGD